MIQKYPIIKEDLDNIVGKKVRDSWIYTHFNAKLTTEEMPTKIALYVNVILPINQNLKYGQIDFVENHCVVIKGLRKWTENNREFECLELDDTGTSNTRLIPVDFPFFEEVQVKVQQIFRESYGLEQCNRRLNRYGKALAELKYANLEKNWYDCKQKPKKKFANNIDENEMPYKYEMSFIKCGSPCFQLKFTF